METQTVGPKTLKHKKSRPRTARSKRVGKEARLAEKAEKLHEAWEKKAEKDAADAERICPFLVNLIAEIKSKQPGDGSDLDSIIRYAEWVIGKLEHGKSVVGADNKVLREVRKMWEDHLKTAQWQSQSHALELEEGKKREPLLSVEESEKVWDVEFQNKALDRLYEWMATKKQPNITQTQWVILTLRTKECVELIEKQLAQVGDMVAVEKFAVGTLYGLKITNTLWIRKGYGLGPKASGRKKSYR
jgi:hypothetical protein